MPFIWNDDSYMDRLNFERKKFWKIDIPLYLVSLIVWSFFVFEKVNIWELFVLALASSMLIYHGVNMFLQLPHLKIPDSYSKEIRTLLYIVVFLFSALFFYIVTVGILQYYYPLFKELACCSIISDFPRIGV